MINGGINQLAKDVSGVGTGGNRFLNSLDKIKTITQKEKADDKFGSLAAGMQIRIIALLITGLIWSFATMLPSSMKEDLTPPKTQQTKTENDKKADQDLFDIMIDLMRMGVRIAIAGGFTICGIRYYRKMKKKKSADIAIEEEMARLREAIEKQDTGAGAGSDRQKFSTNLDGVTLMELFNSFAEIMAIRGDLPRQDDETALEYFRKVAKEINFSKGKAELASRYFEDELYGQHETTEENRKAFLELILSMMEKVKPSKNRI